MVAAACTTAPSAAARAHPRLRASRRLRGTEHRYVFRRPCRCHSLSAPRAKRASPARVCRRGVSADVRSRSTRMQLPRRGQGRVLCRQRQGQQLQHLPQTHGGQVSQKLHMMRQVQPCDLGYAVLLHFTLSCSYRDVLVWWRSKWTIGPCHSKSQALRRNPSLTPQFLAPPSRRQCASTAAH